MKVILCNHQDKSPSFFRSSNDPRRRSEEVSPKEGEPLKEHLKEKNLRAVVNLRATDENPSPKR